ncbi:MAG TPA: hypothetical protein VMQ40_04075 [Acidimicrobiales bacterium]|nr:hypothetical protein [Acidimicrobiales bacterium]
MNVRHVLDDHEKGRVAPTSVHALTSLVRRPTAWWAGATSAIRFAPRGWWRRPPFLPLPDSRYWRFRMETAFGDKDAAPELDDLVTAIHWSRQARRRQR